MRESPEIVKCCSVQDSEYEAMALWGWNLSVDYWIRWPSRVDPSCWNRSWTQSTYCQIRRELWASEVWREKLQRNKLNELQNGRESQTTNQEVMSSCCQTEGATVNSLIFGFHEEFHKVANCLTSAESSVDWARRVLHPICLHSSQVV